MNKTVPKYAPPMGNSSVRKQTERPWTKVLFLVVVAFTILTPLTLYYSLGSSVLSRKHPDAIPKLKMVGKLDKADMPLASKDSKLILIGDVHGSLHQLKKVLKKSNYNSKSDTVVLMGDFISKGPDSEETVDYAIKKDFLCICGNHEHKVLKRYAKYHDIPWTRDFGSVNSEADDTPELLSSDDSKVARKLLPHHVKYISKCPAILELGRLAEHNTSAVAVHAGLIWNIDHLEKQNPLATMFMRSLLPPEYTHFTQESEGKHWTELWNEKQRKLRPDARMAVYYGHDARNGLNLNEYTFGLDTGCAAGGQLTAYVFKRSTDGNVHRKLVQVKCKPDQL